MSTPNNLLTQIRQSDPNLPVEDAFEFPSWFVQQRSWVEDASQSDTAIYNYPHAVRIQGPLRQEVLERCLQEILRRHEVLRSAFRILDAKLVQVVIHHETLAMSLVELRGSDQASKEALTQRVALDDARKPFDLTMPPLLRATLVRLSNVDHVLLLNTHHIVMDDWSSGILLRELFLLYDAFATGHSSSPLPELSFQYADFVRWQQEQLDGSGLSSRLSFWKAQLAHRNDFHHLATDRPRPSRRTYEGALESITLGEDSTRLLKLLSQRERVSLFMTMIAGFQCFLHCNSGDIDIAVGSCAANRPLGEVEGLIGRFGNDLIIRTDFSGNPTFRELLGRVRKAALTAYSYQDLPFGKLVEELEPVQDTSRNPLFQVMFIFRDAPKERPGVCGLTVSQLHLDLGTAKYDLNVWLSIQEGGLEIALEYNSDLFQAATMRQILRDYRIVLEAMCSNPDARVGEIGIQKRVAIGGQQRSEYNGTQYVGPNGAIESRLVELWESVLDRRPIGVNDDFFELGGDSLRAARLFAQIEQKFKRSVPIGTLFRAPTIARLAKVIADTSSGDTCVVAIQPGDTRPPLFCLPGHSGSVLMYRGLASRLGSDQPVYGLQAQGLDGREPPLTRIEDMAANFVRKIQLIQPNGPYFLAGFCMGGTIAFEMAQQLSRQGQTVGLLALLDTYNWGPMKRASFVDDFYFRVQQWWFSWQRGGLRWKALRGQRDPFSLLLVALPGVLPGRKKSLRGFSEFWTKPAAQLVYECNGHAAFSYVPQVYRGRILHVSPTRQCARYKKPEFSLNRFARDGVEEFFLRGYPVEILHEPLVRDLAVKLRACIDEVAANSKAAPERSLKSGFLSPQP